MSIAKLFSKDICRHIEGVIKAEDESVLANELEEFVITDEIRTNLETFLENYNEGNTNGAWISGFFGSGKSHLLKILAAVLENRAVGTRKAAEVFLSLCMGDDNLQLKGLVERAAQMPSRSILFNIGRQADAMGRSDRKDTVLPAFLRVFNQFCGYCAQNAAVAQFERELDERGKLGEFKRRFGEIAGVDWDHEGSTAELFYGSEIDTVFSEITGGKGVDVIGRYLNRTFSVDDFASMVKRYIDHQAPGFRLNFFVDEIGQYVANDTPLMLTLQSIAEALNTECRNRCWIVVTSQSNVSALVGDMSASQGNDFSRIIGRFSTQIQLSSKNVGEVVKVRLLEKTPEAVPGLAGLYEKHAGDMTSVYDFADGMCRYRSYADVDEFVSLYPFVPYQFDLFKTAMIRLSDHDAFTGRFQSIGERSTIEVCQIALKKLNGTAEIGGMIPFDFWYDGIAASIKPLVKSQIDVAENNLAIFDPARKCLAIRILKVLLLAKYVRGAFVASPRNICSLLITDLEVNFAQLLADVKSVLGELESQSYVQRIGDNYEYLTDSEKDLDSDIKHVEVGQTEVTRLLQEILFGDIVRNRKLTVVSGATYGYSQKIDGVLLGRPDGDLAINVISPANPDGANLQKVQMDAFGKDELTVVLKPDSAVLSDMQTYLKTQRYLAQNPPVAQQDLALRALLESRQSNQSAVRNRIRAALSDQVGAATLVVRGAPVAARSTDAQARILEGFESLAAQVFNSFPMISGLERLTEADILRYFKQEAELPGMAVESPAEREITSTIHLNAQSGLSTTMKVLVGKFEKKPYGWPLAVTECLVAKLVGQGKVDLVQGGEPVAQNAVSAVLRNTRGYDTLVLQLQVQITPQQIRELKDFAADFFGDLVAFSEARQVAEMVQGKFRKLREDYTEALARSGELPFVAGLNPLAVKIDALLRKPAMSLYAEKPALDAMMPLKQDVCDRIMGVVNGPQKTMFIAARTFAHEQVSNFTRMREWGDCWTEASDRFETLRQLVESDTVYQGGVIIQIKSLHTKLQNDLKTALEEARRRGEALIAEKISALRTLPDYEKATDDARMKVEQEVTAARNQMAEEKIITAVEGVADRFVRNTYMRLVGLITESAQPPAPPPTPDANGETGDRPVPPPAPKVVSYASVVKGYTKPLLSTSGDIEDYLAYLKTRLEAALAEGKRVVFN